MESEDFDNDEDEYNDLFEDDNSNNYEAALKSQRQSEGKVS